MLIIYGIVDDLFYGSLHNCVRHEQDVENTTEIFVIVTSCLLFGVYDNPSKTPAWSQPTFGQPGAFEDCDILSRVLGKGIDRVFIGYSFINLI